MDSGAGWRLGGGQGGDCTQVKPAVTTHAQGALLHHGAPGDLVLHRRRLQPFIINPSLTTTSLSVHVRAVQ